MLNRVTSQGDSKDPGRASIIVDPPFKSNMQCGQKDQSDFNIAASNNLIGPLLTLCAEKIDPEHGLEKFPIVINNFRIVPAVILAACGVNLARAYQPAYEYIQHLFAEDIEDFQTPDKIVIVAMLYWAIRNYNQHPDLNFLKFLIKKHALQDVTRTISNDEKLSPRWKKNIQGFIELAVFLKYTPVVNVLMEICPKPRRNKFIRTAGYWAALHDDHELFDKTTPDSVDKILAFYQLKENNHIEKLTVQIQRADTKVQKIYQERHCLEFDFHFQEFILPGKCLEPYFDAASHRTEFLSNLPAEVHTCISERALAIKNFVALIPLNQLIHEKITLLANFLPNCFLKLFLFQVITHEINSDELITQWYKNIKSKDFRIIYQDFLRNCDNRVIFLFNLIHRNFYSFNDVDQELFVRAIKTDLLVFKLIISNLMNYCSDPGLIKLLNKPEDVSLSDHLRNTSLQNDTQNELNRLFIQFQLHLRCGNSNLNKSNLNQLPCEMIRKIVEFDDTIARTSRYYYINGVSLSYPTSFFIEGKIHSLEDKIEKYRHKISQLQDDIVFISKLLNDLRSVEFCGSRCIISGRHLSMVAYFFILEMTQNIRRDRTLLYPAMMACNFRALRVYYDVHRHAYHIPLDKFPKSVKEKVSYFNSISNNSISLSDSQNTASLKLYRKKDADTSLQESLKQSVRQRFGLLSVYRHYREEYPSSPTLFSRSNLEKREEKRDEKPSSLEAKRSKPSKVTR